MHGSTAEHELVLALTFTIPHLAAADPDEASKTSKKTSPERHASLLGTAVFQIEKLTNIAAILSNQNPPPKPN